LERLEKYGSWRICKYEQSWKDGEVVDELFECSMRIAIDGWESFYAETITKAIDEALASPREPKYLRAGKTCLWRAPSEVELLKAELKTAVRYIWEGKARFSPSTTNSDVDVFLAKHKDL